jgi:hypothetical protein
MSYYATFEPTQEAMDKVKEKDPLRHYLSTDPNTFLQEAKFTLLHLAIKNPDNASVKTALFQIKMYVDIIKRIAIHDCIEHAMDKFKKENATITSNSSLCIFSIARKSGMGTNC